MHFVYKLDHLFQSTRVLDENYSVIKAFHFSKLISTQDFFCIQHATFKDTYWSLNPFWLHLLFFMHLMIYFQLNDLEIGKGGKQIPLVPVCWTNRYQYPLVPVGSTNRDDPCATTERCGGKFSPTSLAEEEQEWFISAVARTSSSSSQMQAFRPTLLLYSLLSCWAVCGPGSWPNIGFQVVSRPFWPSRWLLFLFLEEKWLLVPVGVTNRYQKLFSIGWCHQPVLIANN